MIPNSFKVFSIEPEIKLQYNQRRLSYLYDLYTLLVLTFLCFLMSIILLSIDRWIALNSHKCFEYTSQYLSDSDLFPLLFKILMLTVYFVTFIYFHWLLVYLYLEILSIICEFLWKMFGLTELLATKNYLLINSNLFGFYWQESIPATSIRYLEFISVIKHENGSGDKVFTYCLNIVAAPARRSKLQFIFKWISILKMQSVKSDTICMYRFNNPNDESSKWLGKLLGDFYQVEITRKF